MPVPYHHVQKGVLRHIRFANRRYSCPVVNNACAACGYPEYPLRPSVPKEKASNPLVTRCRGPKNSMAPLFGAPRANI